MPETTGISEKELIQKCQKGDLKHQEKLYKHFYGYAMGIGLRYLSNRDDVLEVVNDAFIKVFGALHFYDHNQPFKPWLRKILINTAIDRHRKNLKLLEQVDLENAYHVSYPAQAVENLTALDILKLMDGLPQLQRVVFNLYEIDGYSHKEIGNMLKIAVSSSRVYLVRAKEKLKKALIKERENYERTN